MPLAFTQEDFLVWAGLIWSFTRTDCQWWRLNFPTDRVRSTRWEVIISLCSSVHTCRGDTPARSSQRGREEGSSPHVLPWLDLPEVPHLGYPPCRTWPGRYPTLATPHPQPGPGGYPGYPGQGVPPAGGYPPPPFRETDGVLDTPRSVCLLRSRRTFLLNYQIAFHNYKEHWQQKMSMRSNTIGLPNVPPHIGSYWKAGNSTTWLNFSFCPIFSF